MFESSYRLVLSKNGKSFYKQPEKFKLISCLQLITPICEMVYLKNDRELKKDDEVVCSLRSPGGEVYPIFTGSVFKEIPLPGGRIGLILETDLSCININISFVEETAKNILIELLDQAGISDYRIEIPDVTIKRFSFTGTGKQGIFSFLDYMNRYGTFFSFFDENNVFNFVAESDFENSTIEYETGKNILNLGYGKLVSFALPVSAGKLVQVNNEVVRVDRSIITLSDKKSRTEIFWEVA